MTHLDYTWEKRERLIRMEEYADGEAVGKLKGKIDSLLEILEELGDIPEALQTRIQSEKDLQLDDLWISH